MAAVNSVGSEERTPPEKRKKWFDIKIAAKKGSHRTIGKYMLLEEDKKIKKNTFSA